MAIWLKNARRQSRNERVLGMSSIRLMPSDLEINKAALVELHQMLHKKVRTHRKKRKFP